MADETVVNDDSILNTIKLMLNQSSDYTAFDAEIIADINSALFGLSQIGVGNLGFAITGASETWTEYLAGSKNLEAVKTCIYLKVRLAFDPPTASAVIDSFNKQISEWEWRLQVRTGRDEDNG